MDVCVAMILGNMPAVNAKAAKKASLSIKKVTITTGKTKTISIKNIKKATWSVTVGKKIVKIMKKTKTKVTIKGLKAGSAKVQAKVGKKKYVCKVTVKKKSGSTSTANPSVSMAPVTPTASVAPAATTAPSPVVSNAPQETMAPVSTEQPGETGTTAEGIKYKAVNGQISISGYSGEATEITIPEKIEGYQVNRIDNYCFSDMNDLKSVNLPDGLKSIGNWAFFDCSSLESVTIPDGVISLGKSAFACSKLASVTIPGSVTDIGECAFQQCSNLTSAIILNGVTKIENYAFRGCDSLVSITIPNSVTTIGEDAFNRCDNITINCSTGSYAETYAKENSIPYTIME